MATSSINDIKSMEWKMLGAALLVIPHLSAVLTQYLTRYGRKEFYTCIKRPFWNPPFWVATIVWAMSYTFIGISFYIVWVDSDGFQGAAQAVTYLYACLIVLNCSWQILLYNFQTPALVSHPNAISSRVT